MSGGVAAAPAMPLAKFILGITHTHRFPSDTYYINADKFITKPFGSLLLMPHKIYSDNCQCFAGFFFPLFRVRREDLCL